MNTKSGKHVIIDITEYLPGRVIPADFFHAEDAGNFYFQPSDWTEENDWGGDAVARLRKFPACYSLSYLTAEAALTEAEAWEAGAEKRQARAAAQFKQLWQV